MNNNNEANTQIPYEVQKAIENYKNQATSWGLEVRRLESLKVQTEISISNLDKVVIDKKTQIEALENKIKLLTETASKKQEENIKFDKEAEIKRLSMEAKEKELAERIKTVAEKEAVQKKASIILADKEKIFAIEFKKLEEDKAVVSKKINLIKDFSAKL